MNFEEWYNQTPCPINTLETRKKEIAKIAWNSAIEVAIKTIQEHFGQDPITDEEIIYGYNKFKKVNGL